MIAKKKVSRRGAAFANELNRLLQNSNMSQRELAQQMNVSTWAVYNWLNNINCPNPKNREKIRQLFQTKMPSIKKSFTRETPVQKPVASIENVVNQLGSKQVPVTPEEQQFATLAVRIGIERSRGIIDFIEVLKIELTQAFSVLLPEK